MIVPYPAGGMSDTIGRIVVERMQERLGQRILIENVGGADGSIGVGRAARARPDGYTICLGLMDTHVLNGAFYSLPYDVLHDFAPVAALGSSSTVLLGRQSIPANDLGALLGWLKDHPNQASAGMNSISFRLLALAFQKQTATQFIIVPYRAGGELTKDFMAGQIDLSFGPVGILPRLPAGTFKAYAVTSEVRLATAPDIPTFAEMGLAALSFSEWFGLFAPKGVPNDIIARLNATTIEAIADPAVRSRITDLWLEVFPREQQTPEALAALQRTDAEKWWPLIKELGIKAE
jgi:tripartite-type tricarboxylate transporter receptor subunit TctC